jgi:tetratricopeptide (TPR) repeat protein
MESSRIGNALEHASVRGSVVQAGTVSGGVHLYAGAPSSGPPPRELPVPPLWWTNRVDDLAWFDMQRAAAPGAGPLILVVAGASGVGTSALAARWLDQHAADFPDGQLYADLSDQSDPGAAGLVALRFLRALGHDPGPQIPDLDGLAALLRTATRTRRLAVLLDAVRSARQVRALLPAGPGCVAVITTRHRLDALSALGARTVTLGPLPPDAGRALLETALGTARVAAEDEAVEQIAQWCAGLPLALVVAAARLAARPGQPLSALAARLAPQDERLDQLTVDGEDAVSQALDAAYQDLPEDAAWLYRLLGVLPVALLDVAGAAALLAVPEAQALLLLEALVERHLLGVAAAGDFRIPPMVHLHARRCGRDTGEGEAALRRYLEFLLAAATAIEELLTPSHRLLERTYTGPPNPVEFADQAVALGWLARYRDRLLAAVHAADALGLRTMLWQLADALWPLFLRLRDPEREAVHRLGLAAARADGNQAAVGMMLTSLGGTLLSAGRPEEAVRFFREAWQLYRQLGDLRGQGQASNGLAKAAFDQGALALARELFQRALAEREAAGYHRGVALTRYGLGQVALALNEPTLAVGQFTTAYRSLLELGDHYDAAWSAAHLAAAYARLGLGERAAGLIERADTAMEQAGSPFGRAGVAEMAAQIAELRGDRPGARAHLRRAIELFTATAPHRAEKARDRLRQLGPDAAAP